jgi:hypothetical protein
MRKPDENSGKKASTTGTARATIKAKLGAKIEESSFIGVPNIYKTDSRVIRVIWICSLLGSLAYCSATIVFMVLDYFSYSTLINIDLVNDYDMEFPTVTICNLSPIDFSNQTVQEVIKSYLNSTFGETGDFLAASARETSKQNFYNRKICDRNPADFLQMPGYYTMGYTIQKMLISCKYDAETCDQEDFLKVKSQIFNSCYSFNRGRNSSGSVAPIRKTKRAGMLNGFRAELFMGAPEYHPCWVSFQGALVVIHNSTVNPLYVEDGIKLATGVENNLIFSKTVYEKLPKPYSDCVSDTKSYESLASEEAKSTLTKYGVYSLKWCILDCSLAKQLARNVITCSGYLNESIFIYNRCLADISNLTQFYSECAKQCPVECTSIQYELKTTISKYPTEAKADFYLNSTSVLNKFPYQNVTHEQLDKSLLAINVFFNSPRVERVIESPALSLSTLIANLGGQLGLFIGFSLIQLVEIVEVVAIIIKELLKHKIFRTTVNNAN